MLLALPIVSLFLPDPSVAQTMPVPSIPGAGGPGGFLSGLFGGGDRAKESTQLAHMALHEAGNAARLEALLKQLIAMPQSGTAGQIGNIQALLYELARMQESFRTIYDDPAAYGTYEGSIEYRQRQLERQTERLEEMAATTSTIDAKVRGVSASADELATLNRQAEGGLAAQQVGNEAALLQLDLERQQILLQQETWRSLAQQEARAEEERQLSRAQDCVFWTSQNFRPDDCK